LPLPAQNRVKVETMRTFKLVYSASLVSDQVTDKEGCAISLVCPKVMLQSRSIAVKCRPWLGHTGKICPGLSVFPALVRHWQNVFNNLYRFTKKKKLQLIKP